MEVTESEVLPFIIQAASETKIDPIRGRTRGFFAKLVPNVRKLGLLDANDGYLRERWGQFGLMEFEFADDTGSDYETYSAVAADRIAFWLQAARLRLRIDRNGRGWPEGP